MFSIPIKLHNQNLKYNIMLNIQFHVKIKLSTIYDSSYNLNVNKINFRREVITWNLSLESATPTYCLAWYYNLECLDLVKHC